MGVKSPLILKKIFAFSGTLRGDPVNTAPSAGFGFRPETTGILTNSIL